MAGGRHHPASQPWLPGRQYRRDPTLTPNPNPESLPPTNYVGSSYLQTPRPRVTASAQSAQPFSPYAGYSSQPNYSDGSSNAWDAHGRASAFTVNVKTRPLPPQTGWNVSLVSAMRNEDRGHRPRSVAPAPVQPGPGIPLARRESDAASYSSGTTVRSTSLHSSAATLQSVHHTTYDDPKSHQYHSKDDSRRSVRRRDSEERSPQAERGSSSLLSKFRRRH